MRLVNNDGRLCYQNGTELVDVAEASQGRFDADPQAVYPRWDEFRAWVATSPPTGPPVSSSLTGAPVPRPGQCFGIGLNYADHVEESGLATPAELLVFPKFSSCIADPDAPLTLSGDTVDWEVELVAVIGRDTHRVSETEAWDHVAGLTIGQDISDRTLQFAGPAPAQFGVGKSLPGFGPLGPALVTPDELPEPDDLAISCVLNGEVVQRSRTKHLIFDIPHLIAALSAHLMLRPGDVVFTGTPGGVGLSRDPQMFLRPGDQLVSRIEGLGELVTRVKAPPGHQGGSGSPLVSGPAISAKTTPSR